MLVTHHLEEIVPVFANLLTLRGGKQVQSGKTGELISPSLLGDLYGTPPADLVLRKGRYWSIW